MLIAFHKPFGVISQFTPDGSPNRTLAEFDFPDYVYPLGRLDADSEGLLLLSDEKGLNSRLLDPKFAHERTYWAQVERIPTQTALEQLQAGVRLGDFTSLGCRARVIPPPDIPERLPPVRFRKSVPTAWLELVLREGKNRQVRRMTAAVGHPTLRLMRVAVGNFHPGRLECGQWRELTAAERNKVFGKA